MTDKDLDAALDALDNKPAARPGRPSSGVDRKTQMAQAQKKRREKLKAEGKKAITVYLDEELLAQLDTIKGKHTQAEALALLIKNAQSDTGFWGRLKGLFSK